MKHKPIFWTYHAQKENQLLQTSHYFSYHLSDSHANSNIVFREVKEASCQEEIHSVPTLQLGRSQLSQKASSPGMHVPFLL